MTCYLLSLVPGHGEVELRGGDQHGQRPEDLGELEDLPENDPVINRFCHFNYKTVSFNDFFLKGLIDCHIGSMEEVRIAGRIRAGKSSLTLALFWIFKASEAPVRLRASTSGSSASASSDL